MKIEKILYTAQASATGGREGQATSNDNKLNLKLSTPKELGGMGGEGTNPEQLFAAGYAACFIGAMKVAAGQAKKALPADTKISAQVGIGPIPTGFSIQVALEVHIPGMELSDAEAIVEKAHTICPYSNATRGNIQVDLKVV